jgi:hypothetical protein
MRKKLFLLSTLLLSAVGFAQPVFTTAPVYPISVQQGQQVTFSFSYTSTIDTKYEFQILRKNNTSGNIYNGYLAYAAMTLFATSIPVTVNVTVPVEATAALSSSTPYQYTYQTGTPPVSVTVQVDKFAWFGKLAGADPNGSLDVYTAGPDVIINAAPLFVSSYNINKEEMYVNTASKSLVVNTTTVTSDTAKIYDMTGKNVATLNNLKSSGSVDLSGLRNGVFFLITDNNKKIKFAL